MAGELGKSVAEQLKPRLDEDEARKLQTEDDEVYDERVLNALEARLQPEIEAFNGVAPEADQISMQKGGKMLKLFAGERPALGVIPKSRQLLLVKPTDETPSFHFHVQGGPTEFVYQGTNDGRISPNAPLQQDDLLKGILRMSTGKPFAAAAAGEISSTGFYR